MPPDLTTVDTCRDAVYEAEDEARLALADLGFAPPNLTPDELATYATNVLRDAGWVGDCVPDFVLDVADEDDVSGWHQAVTGTLHLHPRLLNPWIVLHELAHWLRPRDGHGPEFCGVLVGLVGAALGELAAMGLREQYRDCGVSVNESWARGVPSPSCASRTVQVPSVLLAPLSWGEWRHERRASS